MEITKEIFGKNYTFECDDSFIPVLLPSIELYPNGNSEKTDIKIDVQKQQSNNQPLAKNPSDFQKFKNAINTTFYKGNIYWKKESDKLSVKFYVTPRKANLLQTYRSLRSMEYATEAEEFEQLLHELVLVPSVYFFKDMAVVHSAVLSIKGKAIMLAGTGGTGKTSASLSLRKNKDVSFIADDIAILSSDGFVYPNLAWPKIYGYNLSSFLTKSELLNGRKPLDKIQFNVKVKRNPKRVRRKLEPNKLYQGYANSKIPVQNVYYLFRDDSKKMYTSQLDVENAVQMGLHVMKTEYNKLFHHYLEWDSYNSIALGIPPILKLETVFDNWERNLYTCFKNADIQLLHIPYDMPHKEYLQNIHKFIFTV